MVNGYKFGQGERGIIRVILQVNEQLWRLETKYGRILQCDLSNSKNHFLFEAKYAT